MRLFKKRDKARRPPEASLVTQHPSAAQIPLLIEIAIEAWRVADRSRKLQIAANRKDPSIEFSIEKIQYILKEMGIEIKDPTGEPYHEGMSLDVLTFDYDPNESPASRIIQETVSPVIYFNGKLIKMAKVIVGSAGGHESHAQDHD